MKNHNKLVQIIEIYMQNVPLRGIIFRTKQDNESPEQTLKRFLSSYGEKVLEHVMKKSFVETTAKKFSSPYGEKVLELLSQLRSCLCLYLSFRPLTGKRF